MCAAAFQVGLGLESDAAAIKQMGWRPMLLASVLFLYLVPELHCCNVLQCPGLWHRGRIQPPAATHEGPAQRPWEAFSHPQVPTVYSSTSKRPHSQVWLKFRPVADELNRFLHPQGGTEGSALRVWGSCILPFCHHDAVFRFRYAVDFSLSAESCGCFQCSCEPKKFGSCWG